MREIKFRVWSIIDKQMIYLNDILCRIPFYELFCHTPDSRPFELMQFIGIKDKNGREIYEGDIGKIIFRTELGITCERNCVMKWLTKTGQWTFEFNNYINYTPDDDTVESIEIIGNIFENGDLLKEE
jgi:uncharacterized phage protein (TIGR01671 family)